MDLNASPVPEEDEEEQNFGEHVEEEIVGEHIETAVETCRREREERRMRLKRECPEEGPKRAVQPQRSDMVFQTRNHRSNDRTKQLPQGWLDCPGAGHPINFIIPSKVPLGESFNDCVLPGKRYSSKQVIHQQRVLGRDIGLVIDLTNTNRYYPPTDWKRHGIKHIKIPCKGRDSVPDNESVNLFVYEVMQFFSRPKLLPKKHILVHCTHGHNRTGFMIIHYLLRSHYTSVSEALHLFSTARPPGIYKLDYIDALYMFYHERRPEPITCPPTPEWKKSSDLDLNGEVVQDEEDDGGVTAALHVNIENEIMTNDDVLGDAISYDQQVDMQRKCCLALGVARGALHFPGSHPVSLDRANLQLLRQRYYYATWKADGTRYMMLITRDGCYLIDRNFSFRRVQMRFPMRHVGQGPNEKTHNYTLLDGEMIIDTLPGTRQLERRYLVYDLMMLNMQSVIERPFYERWKLLEKEVIEPRNSERGITINTNPYYRYDMEPFRVRRKEFWLLSTVTKLLKGFIPTLSHDADGLIFQGWDDPYVPHTHEGLLKWKYPHLNSVDFQFEMGDETRQMLYLLDKGKLRQLEGARVMFQGELDVKTLSGKIIECSYSKQEKCWVCLRTRVDKATPNGWKTYLKVLKSIEDDIKEEDLLNEIAEIVCLPMYADRIAKESQPHAQHHSNSGRRR